VCLVGMCPIEKSSPEAFLPANNIADASGFEDEVRMPSAAASLACVPPVMMLDLSTLLAHNRQCPLQRERVKVQGQG